MDPLCIGPVLAHQPWLAMLVPLSEVIETKRVQPTRIYTRLASAEFRKAIRAEKHGSKWYVNRALFKSLKLKDWTTKGHHKFPEEYHSYVPLNKTNLYQDTGGLIMKVVWQSAAVRQSLGARKFPGSTKWMVDVDLLAKFEFSDWQYVAHVGDYQNMQNRPLIPLSEAIRHWSRSAAAVRKLFYSSEEVRKALGAIQFGEDPRWWVNRKLALNFNVREWTLTGKYIDQPINAPLPKMKHRHDGRRPEFFLPDGFISAQDAARRIGYTKIEFKRLLMKPGVRIALGVERDNEHKRLRVSVDKLSQWMLG